MVARTSSVVRDVIIRTSKLFVRKKSVKYPTMVMMSEGR